MTKFVAIAAMLVCLCTRVQGQWAQTDHHLATFRHQEPYLSSYQYANDAKPRGLRQRNIGRVLTIAGVATGFAGVLVFTDARKGEVIANGQVTQEPEYGKMMAGIYLVEAGIGMFVPGVILWKRGQRKYTRYLEEQSVSFNTTGSSLVVRLKF